MKWTLSIFNTPIDEIKDIQQAVLSTPFENETLTNNHLIIDGITVQQDIPIFGRGALVMTSGPGCEPSVTDPTMPDMAKKSWEPNRVGYRLSFCETDFDKFFSYMKADGVRKADLTLADFWGWLIIYLEENHNQELHRKVWFDDKSITWTGGSPAGQLNLLAKVPFYNQINGLFKQLFAIATEGSAQHVAIAANSTTSQALTNTEAFNTLESMLCDAPIRLRANLDKLRYYVTDSIWCQFDSYLRSQAVDSSFNRIERTSIGLAFGGIPLVRMPNWDVTIAGDFTTAGTADKPHRAVLTYKENIPIGTESESNLEEMDIFYDKKDRKAYMDVFFHLDAKVYLDGEIMFAY